MDPALAKMPPLTKEETSELVSLIEKSTAINNKTTNAATNRLKNEEWEDLTDKFNAKIASCRRTTQQLRLKWENLKKASRKRSNAIRLNQSKHEGNYISSDDILDRVAAMIGGTIEEYTVVYDSKIEPETLFDNDRSVRGDSDGSLKDPIADEDMLSDSNAECSTNFYMPQENVSNSNTRVAGKKRKIEENSDDNRAARNQAIADYYITKRKVLEAKLDFITLEKELLTSKLVCVALEKDKLRSEIEKLKRKD